MLERLQKVLAAAGIASRREAETLIASGKVTVNGRVVTELGTQVDPERDRIEVDGQPIPRPSEIPRIVVALHKPKGWVTTRRDPHATHVVMDLVLPNLERRFGRGHPAVTGIHPVGRLDAASEGLLLLTNDGGLTNLLTHPRHHVPKRYLAEVHGIPTAEELNRLRTGIPLFGKRTLPARVRLVRPDRSRNRATLEIELREGRNQQVRRMCQAVGHPVIRLIRTAVGPVLLGRLKPGQWRFLTPAEIDALRRAATPEPATASGEGPARPARRRAAPARPARGRPKSR